MNTIFVFLLSLLLTAIRPIDKYTNWHLAAPLEPIPINTATASASSSAPTNQKTNSRPKATPTVTLTIKPTPQTKNSEVTITFISPTASQIFKADQTTDIEVNIHGEVSKVEFYIGSGILVNTLSTNPYKITVNLNTYVHGITSNYKLPVGVKAYRPNGTTVYAGTDLNIVPANAPNLTSAPAPSTAVSDKQLEFTRDPQSTNPQARAEGEFTVEQYDSFTNMTSVKTKGKTYGLKSNSEYEVFVITKKGTLTIGSINTDSNGYGEFFTGLGTDQHYCDIYSLGIKQKGAASDQADLWGGQLVDSCPKG